MAGGGSAPQVKETAAEKIAGIKAKSRWNERAQDGYLDLERKQVADSERDYREFFGSRASADVAAKELEANKTMGPATVQQLGDLSNTIRDASAAANRDSAVQAAAIKDNRRINSVRLGSDVAGSALQGFGSSAALAARRATDKVQNKIITTNARNQMIMDLAGAAVQGGAMRKAGYSVNSGGLTGPSKQVYDPKTGTNTAQPGTNHGWMPLLQGL